MCSSLLIMKVIINKVSCMDDRSRKPAQPERHGCARKRIAESDLGAVDVCSCGTWQLHIGAVTLRFAPRELSELL